MPKTKHAPIKRAATGPTPKKQPPKRNPNTPDYDIEPRIPVTTTKRSKRDPKPSPIQEHGIDEPPIHISQEIQPSLSEVERTEVGNPVPRTGYIPTNDIERLLNIKWSKYVPKVPTSKQLAACMLTHMQEVLFGGALGGGKSDWLAYEALRFCDLPGFCSILFRRQLTDLAQPGSLIPRIGEWLAPYANAGDCKYSGDRHSWTFKTVYPGTDIPGPDSILQFGYIGEAAVRERYQSAEYQLVCFDELAQWPEDIDYLFMRTRLRKIVCPVHGKSANGDPHYVIGCRYCDTLSQMPTRIRAATNPGPVWIKRRFGIIPDPTKYKTRHEALIAIAEGEKISWVGSYPNTRPFIPSYLEDNPHLNEKEYRLQLAEMSPEERSRLEDGNWEARKDSRFKRRWQRLFYLNDFSLDHTDPNHPIVIPNMEGTYSIVHYDKLSQIVVEDPIPLKSLLKVFTTTDPAVTTRQGPIDEKLKQKNSSAVVSTWGITRHQDLLWLDCRKFRKEIPDLVDNIIQVDSFWNPLYNKIECNGVGIGVAQYAELANLRVIKNYRKSDKLENSLCAQMVMRAGRVFFPLNAPWVEEIEDDVFGWTGLPAEEDDVVDTLADAATELAPAIARDISNPTKRRSVPRAISTSGTYKAPPHYGL